jgi:hypothetical protein
MELLPQELKRVLPPLYSQKSSSAPIVHALCCREHNPCYVSATVMLY